MIKSINKNILPGGYSIYASIKKSLLTITAEDKYSQIKIPGKINITGKYHFH